MYSKLYYAVAVAGCMPTFRIIMEVWKTVALT